MFKKGSVADLFIWIIVGFISLLFLGFWVYGHNLLTTELVSITSDSINISGFADDTFGEINRSMHLLDLVSFAILFGLGFSILISNFLVRTNPVFFIIYIIFVIFAVIVSAYISNTYETIILAHETFGATFQDFTLSNAILANFPIWVVIIGIFGAILLFINIQRDSGLGGSLT